MEIFPQLFVISPPTVFLRSLAQEAILICFITAAFFHKSNSSALFCSFAAISSRDASLANNFFSACLHVGEDSTPGGWGIPLSRGRKIKRVYLQSYNPGLLGWGFLRLLLRLQLGSLNIGVLSSSLEKDERFILGHVCIYSWKRHTLCDAVLGYAMNSWLNTSKGIVWNIVDLERLIFQNVNILHSLSVRYGL